MNPQDNQWVNSQKKNYHSPSVVLYGHLRTLTASGGNGMDCDTNPGANPPSCPGTPSGNKTR
jgi:hypothetical protein